MINDSLNPFKTYKLNGLDSYFDNFVNQIKNKNLPKVSLLSGNKGIGKFTMVIHLLNFYFISPSKTIMCSLTIKNGKWWEDTNYSTGWPSTDPQEISVASMFSMCSN